MMTKLKFEPFTLFCFACGILSSTQTDYAGVFQIVNENANLSAPTIESAAKVFYGKRVFHNRCIRRYVHLPRAAPAGAALKVSWTACLFLR